MRRYLATLHKKPEHHKKRFAFMVSGSFTFLMFTIWSVVNFGGAEVKVAETKEVSPFDSLESGVATSLEGVSQAFGSLKGTLESTFDMEADYEEMRDNALNTYGR